MGEILLEWARNIIFFMVFLSVISHLLADASYEKYIRFFAGIVLILITVSPLKGGLDFQKIILHLKEEKMTSPQDEETKMVKEKAGEEVSVKVEIPPVITKEKQERPGTESKQEQQLKRKVAQYYGLEEACIEIWWEDDQGEMAVSASVRSDPDDPVYAISGKQQ